MTNTISPLGPHVTGSHESCNWPPEASCPLAHSMHESRVVCQACVISCQSHVNLVTRRRDERVPLLRTRLARLSLSLHTTTKIPPLLEALLERLERILRRVLLPFARHAAAGRLARRPEAKLDPTTEAALCGGLCQPERPVPESNRSTVVARVTSEPDVTEHSDSSASTVDDLKCAITASARTAQTDARPESNV